MLDIVRRLCAVCDCFELKHVYNVDTIDSGVDNSACYLIDMAIWTLRPIWTSICFASVLRRNGKLSKSVEFLTTNYFTRGRRGLFICTHHRIAFYLPRCLSDLNIKSEDMK